MTFDVERLLPQFILHDKNGHAMAKVIEFLAQYMLDTMEKALKEFADVDSMPQWRLDDMAWELGCLYDYNAEVTAKRQWIRDAQKMTMIQGTVDGIKQYLDGYFEQVDIEEWWQYGGEPYHFRMTVAGEMTPEKEAWLRKAIDRAKNARSVLDSVMLNGSAHVINVGVESATLGSTVFLRAGEAACGENVI